MVASTLATVGAERLVVNPSLVLFQRRLFAPNYDGPGKWVIFDPVTRRSMLAIEQYDDYTQRALPAVLRLLLGHSKGAVGLDHPLTTQLVQAGLLVEGSAEANWPTFLSRFQRSIFDYPFFDYSTPAAFQQDRLLMAKYEEDEAAPPPWTPRVGTRVQLPPVTWNDLATGDRNSFDLRRLAAVLRYTFGPTGKLPNLGVRMHYRRTSPSGGAKHPTECWLQVAEPWNGLDPGVYVYDCAQHALVAADPAQKAMANTEGTPLSFSVRSRVERPMWRYRDGRSFRAVLLDAGHIIETLSALLGTFGIRVATRSGTRPTEGYSWLREPEIAVVIPDLPRAEGPRDAAQPARQAHRITDGALVTNPATYFTIENGQFRVNLVHPTVKSIIVDDTDFGILTHCILSHRGQSHRPNDRRTTVEAVVDGVPGATDERVMRLFDDAALLSEKSARPFYGETRRWAERGWYQPLLAWLEAVNSSPHQSIEPATGRALATECNVANALRNRVTTRRFSAKPVPGSTLALLLRDSYDVGASTAAVRGYVAAFNIDGLARNSLHVWDAEAQALAPAATAITHADLIDTTIGQQWLKTSAAAIWLVAKIDVARPETYFMSHVLLGRMAQRICIRATDCGLGVFQTPAVEDRKFASKVGLPEDPAMVAYLVCIGSRIGESA